MKPNNDKLPLTQSLERSLDPLSPEEAMRNGSKILSWLFYLCIGFVVLLALNYAWLDYARTHGYYPQSAKVGIPRK